MKNILVNITIVLTILNLINCGGSKPVSVAKVNEEVEVSVPCSEFFTDTNFFRGQGVAQSRDLNTAREKARMAANTELAGSIGTWVKQLNEKYVNDAGQSPADYEESFESLSRQKIDEQMSNITVVCNKTMKLSNNMYKVYLAVEVDRKKVFESFDKAYAADKKLGTLYNKERFRATYEAEMETFKNSK